MEQQVTIANMKSLWRVLEKFVLRPTAGLPWDIVRARKSGWARSFVSIGEVLLSLQRLFPGLHETDFFAGRCGEQYVSVWSQYGVPKVYYAG